MTQCTGQIQERMPLTIHRPVCVSRCSFSSSKRISPGRRMALRVLLHALPSPHPPVVPLASVPRLQSAREPARPVVAVGVSSGDVLSITRLFLKEGWGFKAGRHAGRKGRWRASTVPQPGSREVFVGPQSHGYVVGQAPWAPTAPVVTQQLQPFACCRLAWPFRKSPAAETAKKEG